MVDLTTTAEAEPRRQSPDSHHAAPSDLRLRPARADDSADCGRICYEAFRHIAGKHKFPEDFPSPEVAAAFFRFALGEPGTYVVVAELNGRVIGSNMSWEQTPISGVGPITVDPDVQNMAVGRRLMTDVLDRAARRGALGVRLVQAAYHNRSLSLYAKLGFDAREPLSVFQGRPLAAAIPGHAVRPATDADVPSCVRLHERLHGFSREGDVTGAISRGTANVVERDSAISGYSTDIGFFGHAVGETNQDLMALIGAAQAFSGPGFLMPTRNAEMMRWCLGQGLRIVQPMTLMSRGFYQSPEGAYLPSILF